DLPADEERSHDQGGDDLYEVIVTGGKESEITVHTDDFPEIGRQFIEMTQDSGFGPALAPQQRDRLGILPEMDEIRPEIGLFVELAVIQLDQGIAESDGQIGTRHRVNDGHAEQ